MIGDFEVKNAVRKSGVPITELAFMTGIEVWNLRNYLSSACRWPVGLRERVLDVLEKCEQPGKYSDLKEFILDMGFKADSSLELYRQHEPVSTTIFEIFKQKRIKFADAKSILSTLVENA